MGTRLALGLGYLVSFIWTIVLSFLVLIVLFLLEFRNFENGSLSLKYKWSIVEQTVTGNC